MNQYEVKLRQEAAARDEEYLFRELLKQMDDTSLVKEWLEKRASEGDTAACCNLGYLYEMGWCTDLDKKKAIEWYRKAMELGDPNAEELLKRCKKSTGLGKLLGIFS